MNKIFRKLRSRSGETLTEMLVSIVILGLSIAMMVTMIITSTHLAEQSTKKDEDYRTQLTAAEKQDGNGEAGTVNITSDTDSVGVEIPVEVYGQKDEDDKIIDGVLKSYKGKK